MGVWLGIEAAGEEYILRYAYKYNKIFIIQHQRCLGTLPAGSSAVSMLISCEIPNKHIFSSFSHLTLCLWNKSVTLVVKSAASPFSDPDYNQMFNFCLVVGMVEAYMYVWRGILPSFSPFWVMFLLWKALNIWQRLFPQASFLGRHHTRQYSVEVPSTFPKNRIVCFFLSLSFMRFQTLLSFLFFITGLEGLHSSEALKRFLNIHWRMCNYGFENKKQVQKQSGAKQGLKCDGRHTAAHMLFKMIYYSSADLLFAVFFRKHVACCLLFSCAAELCQVWCQA